MADMPTPESLTVHAASRVLEIGYSDGQQFCLPFELMRVYSPSAEVQGHGPGQEVLQTGKREVTITDIEQVGNYAIKPFSATATKAVCSPGTICTNWVKTKTSCGKTTLPAWKPPGWTAMRRCLPSRAAAVARAVVARPAATPLRRCPGAVAAAAAAATDPWRTSCGRSATGEIHRRRGCLWAGAIFTVAVGWPRFGGSTSQDF